MSEVKILRGPTKYSVPKEHIGQYLFAKLQGHDESKILLEDAGTRKHLTTKEMNALSIKLACSLKRYGIKQGDVICAICENALTTVLPVIASFYIGATIHLLNPAYTTRELKHVFELSKPRIAFCSKSALDNVIKIKAELDYIEKVISIDGSFEGSDNIENFMEIGNNIAGFRPEVINSGEQVALILSSSGTTGQPKGVMITYDNLRHHLTYIRPKEYVEITSDTVLLLLLPLFHIFGLFFLIFGISESAKIVILNKFKPEIFLKSLEEYKINKLTIVPSLAVFLAKSALIDEYDLSSLEDVMCGSAPLGQDIMDILESRLKVRIRQLYGLTEIGGVTAVNPTSQRKPNSAGSVIPNLLIKIRNPENQKVLGAFEIGEICIKGPTVTKGYISSPESTKAAFDEEGYFLTGDIGYYDKDEDLYIIDRIKELIKYKGFQVPPAELESILLTHNGIKEAAVIGIPDERAGELPMACVVKQEDSTVTEQELIDFVAGQVSVQKRLYGGVKFIDEIPKHANGKTLRRILRDMLLK